MQSVLHRPLSTYQLGALAAISHALCVCVALETALHMRARPP